jgi:hypothetical protein
MSKWTAKDVLKVFADQKSIEKMYRYRFMAFVLVNLDRYNKLQKVNKDNPSKDDLQLSINGCNDILKQFETFVQEDAAVYSTFHAKKTDKGIDLKAISAEIDGKEINKKYVQNAEKNNPSYQKDFEFLKKTQEEARKNAIKIIQNGDKIEYDEFNQRILENTMGKEYADAMKAGSTKYKTWKNVTSTEAFSKFASTKEGSDWFNDAKYGSLTAAGKAAKDTVYDTVMGSETNFLTAPVKLFFFGIHEILNPNSTLNNMLGNIKKWKENKEAEKKYREMGLNGFDLQDSGENSEELTKKSVTKSIKEIQRELIKGYNFKKDLEEIGYDEKRVNSKKEEDAKKEKEGEAKKEQPAQNQQPQSQQQQQKNESWIREANENKEIDKLADSGEDEKSEEHTENKGNGTENKLSKEDLEKLQNTIVSVVLRYNCLLYIMMRSFAGTYGQMKEFQQFSIRPFTIEENKQEEVDKAQLEKIKKFFSSEEGKQYNVKDLKDASNLPADKRQAIYTQLVSQEVDGAIADKVLGTNDGVAESFIFVDYVKKMINEATENKDPYKLVLSKGVDHWIKSDPIMARMIQRNQNLKVEIQKNSKFSTFFAYARLFEDFIQEYRKYIDGIESNPNFEKIKNVDLKLTGIKNLKLIECTTNLQKNLAILNKDAKGNLRDEVRREYMALSMFRKITNITNFLTIRNLDFKNMKAFFKILLPRLEMLRRPTNVSCTLSKETASKVFGEKGIPYAVKKSQALQDKEQAEKLYKGV